MVIGPIHRYTMALVTFSHSAHITWWNSGFSAGFTFLLEKPGDNTVKTFVAEIGYTVIDYEGIELWQSATSHVGVARTLRIDYSIVI